MSDRPQPAILRLHDESLDWRAVEGEVLALDLGSSEYLGVNRSGAVLWRELASGSSRAGLIERLMAETRIETSRAEDDVDRFLAQLRARGLLGEEPEAAA
ncbi:MAG: PqqD family protein [Solirubrobacteraceae bacterium]